MCLPFLPMTTANSASYITSVHSVGIWKNKEYTFKQYLIPKLQYLDLILPTHVGACLFPPTLEEPNQRVLQYDLISSDYLQQCLFLDIHMKMMSL